MAILFAFLAFFGWGVGDIFGAVATRKIGPYSTTIWFIVFQFLLFIVFAPFFLSDLKNLTFALLLLNLALGLVAAAASTTFYEAMKEGSASLAGTLVGSFAALTVILSLIFLGEKINQPQSLSIIIIFAGIVISSLDFQDLKAQKLLSSRSVLFALVSMVCWGVYWAFLKIPVQELGWYWPIVLSQLMYVFVYFFMRVRRIKLVKPTFQGILPVLILNSLILGIGSFSYNLGIERGLVAVVAPIAGAYSALFAVLAYFVFRDPLRKKEIFGIVITLFGIVLLSIFSA
ncbi:MAG: DMT family transporter [bacterium]|nr:DMT family transporter [bacterium]